MTQRELDIKILRLILDRKSGIRSSQIYRLLSADSNTIDTALYRWRGIGHIRIANHRWYIVPVMHGESVELTRSDAERAHLKSLRVEKSCGDVKMIPPEDSYERYDVSGYRRGR